MAVSSQFILFCLLLITKIRDGQAQGGYDVTSCDNRCPGQPGDDIVGECSCDKDCMKNINCCYDYFEKCFAGVIPTCQGMCDVARTPERPCDCSPECIDNDDCCPDYNKICLKDAVSDEEIQDMAESLLFWEDASLLEQLEVNKREKLESSNCNQRYLPRLLEFKDDQQPTYTATYENIQLLYNDYNPNISIVESMDPNKRREIGFFQSSLLETRLMKGVINFLIKKGFVAREATFQRKFQQMWFDPYKRSNSAANDSSSGFEHVFLGEINTGREVGGFHNWIYLMSRENNMTLDYYGYLDYLSLNKKASIISINFKWLDHCKRESSMFIGTSPELEFALYTLCWFTRPDQPCTVSMAEKRFTIQTYVHVNHYGAKFVASAYPVLSASITAKGSTLMLVLSLAIAYFKSRDALS